MDASTSVSLLEAEYDYVVVGGGTAGLVVASRLSEDDQVKVIVLEAGDNHLTDPRINTPAGWSAVLGSEVDWSFKTSAQVVLHPPSHQNQVTDSAVASKSNFLAESFAIPRVEYLEDQARSTQKPLSLHPRLILKHGSASAIQAVDGT